MQILLLTTSFPVKEGASSGIFVERLAQRLGRNCRLRILAPSADSPAKKSNNKPYELVTFRYAPTKWQILAHGGGGIPATLNAQPWTMVLLPFFLVSMFLRCVKYAREADIIFANWSICGVIAGVVGGITGRPVVTTLRGEDANRAQSSRIHRFLISLCFRLNRRVVTVSNDIAMHLSKLFPAFVYKIVMIPNGVDSLSLQNNPHKIVEKSTINLIMVGSLIPRKAVSTALYALDILPQEFVLTILGDGPEMSRLRSLVNNLGMNERVCFAGHIQPEQISLWFADADVLVMTSKSEGRPNVVLEALAAGIPVVGSDIPGLRELILPNVNGVLFPFEDHKALASSLLRLADRELRIRLGEGGQRFIEEKNLTWENTAARYMSEFRQFCSKENA